MEELPFIKLLELFIGKYHEILASLCRTEDGKMSLSDQHDVSLLFPHFHTVFCVNCWPLVV